MWEIATRLYPFDGLDADDIFDLRREGMLTQPSNNNTLFPECRRHLRPAQRRQGAMLDLQSPSTNNPLFLQPTTRTPSCLVPTEEHPDWLCLTVGDWLLATGSRDCLVPTGERPDREGTLPPPPEFGAEYYKFMKRCWAQVAFNASLL